MVWWIGGLLNTDRKEEKCFSAKFQVCFQKEKMTMVFPFLLFLLEAFEAAGR